MVLGELVPGPGQGRPGGQPGRQGQDQREIFDFLEQTFSTRTRDEWFELLKDQNISVGKVYSLEEALADPQVVHRGMVVEVEARTFQAGGCPR